MAIMVGKRARAELGVEPCAVIMMERGAAQFPLFTKLGYERLRDDPVEFFQYWNPTPYLIWKTGTDIGKRTMDMWQIDQLMDQETLEVGYHLFRCPMIALQASSSVLNYVQLRDFTDA